MKRHKMLSGKRLLTVVLTAAMVLSPISVGAAETDADAAAYNVVAAEEVVPGEEGAESTEAEAAAAVTETETEAEAETEEPVASETAAGDTNGKAFKRWGEGGTIFVIVDPRMNPYTGSEIKPEITVYDDDLEDALKEGTDYTVSFANNKEPGTATATLTGTGNYSSDSIKEEFTIYEAIKEADLTVEPHGTYFTVTNNRSDITLYLDFVSEADDAALTTRTEWVLESTELPAGGTKDIYSSLVMKGTGSGDFEKKAIEKNTQYVLKVSPEPVFQYNTTVDFKGEKEKTTGEDSASTYKDAYTEAGMTAVVQKNGTVKLAWKPKEKSEKFFALFQRDANDSKWEKIWPDTSGSVDAPGNLDSKKNWTESYSAFSANQKDPKKLEVYLLVTGTAKTGGDVVGKYIAPVAPYLLYVENADDPANQEMGFAFLPGTENLSYRLQMAKTNKEKSEKAAEGYSNDWSVDCGSKDLYSIGDWNLSKTVSLEATRAVYDKGQPVLTAGTKYFNRVKTVYTFEGKEFVSAPSNVISRKSGPGRTYTLSVVGLKHDAKNSETNRAYAQAYIDGFIESASESESTQGAEGDEIPSVSSESLGEVYGVEGEVTLAEEIDDAKAAELQEIAVDFAALGATNEGEPDYYAHRANDSTEIKNGYVFFFVPKSSIELKSFDLLKSNTSIGTFSKAKSYNFPTGSSKDIWKLNIDKDNLLYFEGYDLYCLWYNNFPPEQTIYYAVRSVAKAGNSVGGFSKGVANTGRLDAVQDIEASDNDSNSITVTWDHDDCPKKYLVYRSRVGITSYGEDMLNDEWDFNEKNYVQIAAVSATAKKTDKATGRIYNTYVDKGNYKDKTLEFKEEMYYAYVVKPVYDTKKVNDFDYNLDLISDIGPGKLSIKDVSVQKFTGANYCAGTIKLKWQDNKKLDNFRLARVKADGYKKASEVPDSAWTVISQVASKKGTSMLEFSDDTAVIGTDYFYAISGGVSSGSASEWGKWTYFNNKLKSVPLPVVSARANANGGNKGARLTWNVNSLDKGMYTGGQCKVMIKWSDSNGGSQGWLNASTTGYPDNSSLATGITRTYTIAVFYQGKPYSAVSVKYTLTQGSIVLYYENGTVYTSSSLEMTNNTWAPLLGNVIASGQVLPGVSVTAQSSNTGVVEVSASSSGNYTKFSLHAKSAGSAVITFGAQGAAARSIVVTVK